jgi:hypothetical protein
MMYSHRGPGASPISRFAANRDPDSRFPAESGIGDSLCPDSRPNRESGERELGISGSGPALRESPVGMVNPWTPKTNCNSRACR